MLADEPESIYPTPNVERPREEEGINAGGVNFHLTINYLTDYVYRDEHAVGLSLATASVVITPITVTILGIGRAGLRESLARAKQTYDGPESA